MVSSSRRILRSTLTLVGLLATASIAYAQSIRKIPAPTLPDIAIASYDAAGPVIYYNPAVTTQLDQDIVAFFMKHEEGHHALHHLQREYFDANPWNRAWVRQSYEKEADCYAAKALVSTNPAAVNETISYFEDIIPGQVDWYHPPGYERAQLIRSCEKKDTTSDQTKAASSSDFCQVLEQYVAAKRSDFQNLKGKYDGDGDYTATITLPGSKWCDVMLSEGSPPDHYITCTVTDTYENMIKEVESCYPSWEATESFKSKERSDQRTKKWSGPNEKLITVREVVYTKSSLGTAVFVTVD